MKREPILQIRDVSCAYEEGILALDQVTADIHENEKIAVIGANGAGKSTFFLCINGVIRPDSGRILFHGANVDRRSAREMRTLRAKVGIVFQDADSQIIAPTVFSEVSFGPMNLKLPRDEVRRMTENGLEYMDLKDLSDRPPHCLSGGEKKRVTIADIIAMDPEIYIFDEPATALDPVSQQMLEDVLGRLQEAGKTLMVSTHDVDFAYRFAQRILVFSEGRILKDGSPEEVFSDDAVLAQAHLKRPALFELRRVLIEKGLLPNTSMYPKTIQELSDLL